MPDKDRRAGWPFALLTVVCAAAVVAALTGATTPLAASRFANTGHWVFNSVLGAVFHVDGATTNIDARVPMSAEDGSQVLQSDTSGFVVGAERITEFDKESLRPRRSATPPADETPVGIEVVGGPYAVYRDAGVVVRLGDPTATVEVGGPVGTPVVTEDGTMWLHRTDDGRICRLEKDGTALAGCPASAPEDHAGALTVVGGRPAFVDLFTSTLHAVDGDHLGAGVPLGARLSPDARPAERDADGRLAILDPTRDRLVLVDTTGKAAPVTVALAPGDYAGPVATGDVVVVVDRRQGTVLTYGADGKHRDTAPIKDKSGEPRLNRGEDERIYVEDEDGTQVVVVDEDGGVRGVDVDGAPEKPVETPKPKDDPKPRDRRPADPPQRTAPPETTTPPPPLPPGRPGAPGRVNAQAGNASATVTWDPAPDNRSPITSYVVTWAGGSATYGPATRRVTIPGLANGTAYTFTVTAANQVGSGPGASSAAVTPSVPVAPAAPPVNTRADYDPWDQPTRDVTVSWGRPALNGGTLAYYEVAATGRATQNVPGTSLLFPQVDSTEVITFTVRAVTRGPAGQLIRGAAATATHDATQPRPVSVQISRGGPSETGNCHAPDCSWVIATVSGLDPDTNYEIRLSSTANENVRTEEFTSGQDGSATYDQLNYDVPGETVWVSVLTSDGWVKSNELRWE